MSNPDFTERLRKDLQKSAPKTALLALLLFVGLYFWVPPLLKAFSGSGPPAASPAPATTASNPPPTLTTSNTSTSQVALADGKSRDSTSLNRLMKECATLQPANLEELPSKPFTLDTDQFPIPVLVSDDEEPSPLPPAAVVAEIERPAETLFGLSLKSTIVGPQRRAAWLGSRLFQEGQIVPWNGRSLRLTEVNRTSVTLTDGVTEWQLKLAEPTFDAPAAANMERTRNRDDRSKPDRSEPAQNP